jgi:cardiolipin synthase A/B
MPLYWVFIYSALGWVIILVMIGIVLRRKFAPGASLAWLGIVFLHPYVGVILFYLLGEKSLGLGRIARHQKIAAHYRELTNPPQEADLARNLDAGGASMAFLSQKIGKIPVVLGNEVDFLDNSTQMVDRLVADINAASVRVNLLYYMFAPDATGRKVAEALGGAVKRGVNCRLLADAFASREIFRHGGLAGILRQQGIKVTAALPSAPFRRRDLRDHRKLAVIDERIAYAGSQNLVNADYGGRRGAPWYDLTGRFTGPVVQQFATVFAENWAFETDEMLAVEATGFSTAPSAGIPMQVVPTGPIGTGYSYRGILMGAIQTSRHRLVLTTPYFVPDEPTLVSLTMAADRGVDVTLILPKICDQFYTAAAGRAHYTDLLEAGVSIYLYRPGLIHTKSVTVDDSIALLGSANLDMRSFYLNFELSVLLYGGEATGRLRAIQNKYLMDSDKVDRESWGKRPALGRYADAAVCLISPLL